MQDAAFFDLLEKTLPRASSLRMEGPAAWQYALGLPGALPPPPDRARFPVYTPPPPPFLGEEGMDAMVLARLCATRANPRATALPPPSFFRANAALFRHAAAFFRGTERGAVVQKGPDGVPVISPIAPARWIAWRWVCWGHLPADAPERGRKKGPSLDFIFGKRFFDQRRYNIFSHAPDLFQGAAVETESTQIANRRWVNIRIEIENGIGADADVARIRDKWLPGDMLATLAAGAVAEVTALRATAVQRAASGYWIWR